MNRLMRRATTLSAAGALLLGGAVTMAPSASAVGKSACKASAAGLGNYVDTTSKFRSGPGTKYTAKGLLTKNTKVTPYCSRSKSSTWSYVKVNSGAHKGKKGWSSYVVVGTQLD